MNVALHIATDDGADLETRVERVGSAEDLIARIRELGNLPGGPRRDVVLNVPRKGRKPITVVRSVPESGIGGLHELLDGVSVDA